MKWSVTTAPTSRPIDWSTLKLHLRIDTDEEQTLVEGYEDAAVDYAQDEMCCALMPQTITAVYYADDVPTPAFCYPFGGMSEPYDLPYSLNSYNRGVPFRLPRGPVLSVTSVTNAAGTVLTANTDYVLEAAGSADILRVSRGIGLPMTVVYRAGYANAASVPAAVRQALLVHVGTLYENRESVITGTIGTVPHSLADFYRIKRREGGIG